MKVLFFHPSDYLQNGIPQGIAILSAVLKKEGHIVDLFDTTFLKPNSFCPSTHGSSAETLLKPTSYTLEDLVADDPQVDIIKEFQKLIDKFVPDLIAVSTMTTNYNYAIDILEKLTRTCPIIFGGVHPTICPDEVISENVVDIVCIGDGESALIELCDAIQNKKDYSCIRNLWVKKRDKSVVKNELRPFTDLDLLPCPDWSIFDKRHLFRPFMGEIYIGGFYISSRGCPARCTYCVNASLQQVLKSCGKYLRFQKPETTIKQLTELKEKYGATWIKFADDNFLLQSIENLEKIRDGIKPLNIQFGCSVRPDSITDAKIKLAKDMGCVAMSVGIESGNEEIRKNILNRKISDEQLINSFKILNANGVRISTFNLIGLPGESRENVFETINLNRKLGVKAANVYIVYPFPDTHLAKQNNVKNKNNDGTYIPMNKALVFNFSKMAPQEVEGLEKTFNLYLQLPEELWPIIKFAEGNGYDNNIVYDALKNYATSLLI